MNAVATLRQVSNKDNCLAEAGPTKARAKDPLSAKGQRDEKLLQAQRLEVAGSLAAGVAHDFNNILTAIAFNAQVLISSLDRGDPLRKGAEVIKLATKRASSLTDQLLTLSRH